MYVFERIPPKGILPATCTTGATTHHLLLLRVWYLKSSWCHRDLPIPHLSAFPGEENLGALVAPIMLGVA